MKITMRRLRNLLSEQAISRILAEETFTQQTGLNEDESAEPAVDESGDSVDSQVDRYFAQYETDAKKADGSDEPEPGVDQMESIEWRDLVRGVILEAGESDKDATDDDSETDAPGADELTGNDTDKLGLDKLDVEAFANDVVRLINNYDSLLEVRSTLMRRAKVFLKKSYSDEVVSAFEDSLRDDHGMEAGTDDDTLKAEKFPAPPAARAGGNAEGGAPG